MVTLNFARSAAPQQTREGTDTWSEALADLLARQRSFTFVADGRGVHAERTFTLAPAFDGRSTLVISDETQVGPLPWLGRLFLGPRLRAVNQVMFRDLAQAATTRELKER